MSHVAQVDTVVDDLASLRQACEELGLEFKENQTSYKWYGRWVGDFTTQEAAVSQGIDPKTFGQCVHAIGLPSTDPKAKGAYELGVVKNPKGDGYILLYDNWMGAYGLEEKIGKGADILTQQYAMSVVIKTQKKQGWQVQRKWNAAHDHCQIICTK